MNDQKHNTHIKDEDETQTAPKEAEVEREDTKPTEKPNAPSSP